jgi:SpoVK/Ycf46/Vps4 family AAA+-type ATPase
MTNISSNSDKRLSFLEKFKILDVNSISKNYDEDYEFYEENDDKSKHKTDYTKYLKIEGDKYFGYSVTNTVENIPSGFYKFTHSQQFGVGIVKSNVNLDELFELPFKESKEIIDDIKKFWKSKDKYDEYNYTHKRGILLYGKPGNGKTSIINLLTLELINKHNGIVFSINTPDDLHDFKEFVPSVVRNIEPNRPIICTIEDIDSILSNYGHATKSSFLNLLDGSSQVTNIVYIATTNYPEQLEENITNRPSRFDRRYEIGLPDDDVRRVYIQSKIKKDDLERIDLDHWVNETKGFSISHIKELIISVIIFGNDLEESLSLMRQFIDIKSLKTKQGASKIGLK